MSSNGDATHYVNLQVRFVDGDGVRVELATDSVSDLLVGEKAPLGRDDLRGWRRDGAAL